MAWSREASHAESWPKGSDKQEDVSEDSHLLAL